MNCRNLLEIDDLSVCFYTAEGTVRAVERVSLSLAPGETLGLVGESGSGKSVTALSIMGLVPAPPGRVYAGRINFEGRNLLELDAESLRRTRGRDIAMIFQEPMAALNPVLTIGRQVAEPLMVHQGLSRCEAYHQAAYWLERVKFPASRKQLGAYPHQLSGGMRQRVMTAMALVCRPKLLIADEPTTALDVTLQSQVLALIAGLKQELDMAVLLITHDPGIVAQMTQRVVVMYAGMVVEAGMVTDMFDQPFHPYTRGLLNSMPRRNVRGRRLREIPGTVPPAHEAIMGCKFAERCRHAFTVCRQQQPELMPIRQGQHARCWLKIYPGRRKRDD